MEPDTVFYRRWEDNPALADLHDLFTTATDSRGGTIPPKRDPNRHPTAPPGTEDALRAVSGRHRTG